MEELSTLQAASHSLAAQRRAGAWFNISAEVCPSWCFSPTPKDCPIHYPVFLLSESSWGVFKRDAGASSARSGEMPTHQSCQPNNAAQSERLQTTTWVILWVPHGRAEWLWALTVTKTSLSSWKLLIWNTNFQSWSDRTKELFDAWSTWKKSCTPTCHWLLKMLLPISDSI